MSEIETDLNELREETRQVLGSMQASIEELKAALQALQILRDVQKIAVPGTPHAPGSATAGRRDWSKVSNDKLKELHSKYLAGSPKWIASTAELKARGIQ